MSEERRAHSLPTPGTRARAPLDMPEDLVDLQVDTALGILGQDPRIAWRVLQEAHALLVLGPWTADPTRRDHWVRRNPLDEIVATVWWQRKPNGELVESQAARASIECRPEMRDRYPTVAVALIWTDAALRKLGWLLVPPFGQTVD